MTIKRGLLVLACLVLAAAACNLPAASEDEQPSLQTLEAQATLTAGAPTGAATTPAEESAEPPASTDTPGGDDEETPTAEATGTETSEPTGTATRRPATQPSGDGAPEFGDEIYSTDFRTGWVEVTSADQGTIRGRATPTDQGLLFEVEPSWGLWVYTQQDDVSTFYAEVTAAPRDCPPGSSAYGLMFQFRDNDNFRAFAVTCSGDYRLYDFSDTGDVTLAMGELPGGIDTSTGEHTLGVMAQGNRLTVYVDNRQVDAVQVDDMPAGDVGPFVDTFGEGIAVTYRRLAVYEPD